MLEQFQKHIETNLGFLIDSKVLIAISGGVDSVVLTDLCYKLNINFSLAHCNFNLRGSESDADEVFVLQLAEDLDVEVFVESFDTIGYAEENKRSIQMAARELRYNWFSELAGQLKFDYILTAHHADDNLETFLINFTRGTGLEGLTGIPQVNGNFVRPLLPFSREEIDAYTQEHRIVWRNDSSNISTKYLRNKLRHEVIPILKEINPSILHSFQNTLNHLNDTSALVDEAMDVFLNEAIISVDSHEIKYQVEAFKKLKQPRAYLYEAFKDYGFTQWEDILNLLTAQPGKYVASSNYRLIKDRGVLLLTKNNSDLFPEEIIPVLNTNTGLKIPSGILEFSEVDTLDATSPEHCVYIDKGLLKSPLTVRQKKPGDTFCPLGMRGKKKKLSKYFKDEKFSLVDKENTWLFCSDDTIVWVIGKRADDRFKVTDKTKQILKIEFIQ